MNKSFLLHNLLWPISTLVMAILVVNLIPQPSMSGCPLFGPCHQTFTQFLAGLFVFISLVIGPKKRPYYFLVFLLLIFWCSLESLRNGELTFGKIWEIFPYLHNSAIFVGGIIGFIFGFIIILILRKLKSA